MNITNDVRPPQIPRSSVATPAASGVGVAARGASASAPVSAESQDSDQATLSAASGELSTALDSSDSDVRTARVASLQAAILAGTYNVPASSVAEKILSSMLKP